MGKERLFAYPVFLTNNCADFFHVTLHQKINLCTFQTLLFVRELVSVQQLHPSLQDHYRLTFGPYEGTAGDALAGAYQAGVSEWAGHQGMRFSTYDQDNDNYRGNCAEEDKGGWWFNK